MERTIFNPQKGRLETIDIDFTAENTTWFAGCRKPGDIELVADYHEDELLIKEYGWNYPVRIYDLSRSSIGHDQKKAREVLMQALGR